MSLLEGIGHVSWWGYTPSQDLTKYCTHNKAQPLRVLALGANDLRHVLEMMCSGREVEVYIMETNLEIYCRHVMFLSILLQPTDTMGLQEKTELYLDMFGNSLVRSASMKFVKNNVPSYIRMITDEDYLRSHLPILDLSLLKFKERDFMESIFKFWSASESKSAYQIEALWDARVRAYLGGRYDAGRNIFDMDFSMKLKERAQLLDFNEYATWRKSGISYDVRDGVFDIPNRTLSSGIIKMIGGEKRLARGYWGDIVSSPYLAHGIYTPIKSMYEVRNRTNVRTASEVAEYNVMSLIYQINCGKKYTAPPKPDRFSFAAAQSAPSTLEEVEEEEEEEKEEEEEENEENEEEENIAEKMENINIQTKTSSKVEPVAYNKPHCNMKIKFLSLGTAEQLPQKRNLLKTFDLLYFSSSQVSYFTPQITALLKDDANVVVENIKFIAPITKEQEAAFLPKIRDLAFKAKCELLGTNDLLNNNFHLSYHRTEY